MPVCKMRLDEVPRVRELIAEAIIHLSSENIRQNDRRWWINLVEKIDWEYKLANKDVFVFALKKMLLGVVSFDRQIGVIDLLYVDHECWNDGIGSHLVRFVEKYAMAQGFISIMVYANNNAVSFYERLGYTNLRSVDAEISGTDRPITCYLMKKYF